jgi:hypothetical protein
MKYSAMAYMASFTQYRSLIRSDMNDAILLDIRISADNNCPPIPPNHRPRADVTTLTDDNITDNDSFRIYKSTLCYARSFAFKFV